MTDRRESEGIPEEKREKGEAKEEREQKWGI